MLTFNFKGVDSATKGVYLTERPSRFTAERQMAFTEIKGRAGSIVQDFGGWDDYEINLSAYINSAANYAAARAWLQGSGTIVFSDEPGRSYRATIYDKVELTPFNRNASGIFGMKIPVRMKPFGYHYPAPTAITVAASGNMVNNTGTAPANPLISVTGSGDIVLVINGFQIDIDGLTGGVLIDCEMMEVFNADRTELRNSICTMDEFPRLDPGNNIITWTGTVTQLKIQKPRWRDV